ncbi:MAG: TPR end-of-group domain-containing protein [Sphingobacteriia bacterium]
MLLRLSKLATAALMALLAVTACTPEGVINKTNYEGRKVTNTCDQFTAEVTAIIDANAGASVLRVAEYDNSSYNTMFLEPGQFEQVGNTLYFRLVNDLQYEKYLHKRVAILVKVNYKAQEHLSAIESSPEGTLGTLTIDRAYYDANKEPFFVYKVETNGKIDGKQLSLSFSVVKLNKKGAIKKVYCNSVEMPLGPIDPGCCTDRPWVGANTQSVVDVPNLNIRNEQYRYQGFTGTLDLIFPMSSTVFKKDSLNNAIINYAAKYEDMGFKLKAINIDGYCSQGGTVELNQGLSNARAEAVYNDLVRHYERAGRLNELKLTYAGKGEDWNRFEQLVKTVNFEPAVRSRLLAIANGPEGMDEKERILRDEKLLEVRPSKSKLVTDVLEYCRHTFVTFQFEYVKDRMFVEYYPSQIPVISPALFDVARQEFVITEYKRNVDANKGLGVLNTLIDVNNNRTANLFAMRSTYHFALTNVKSAINDIESAMNLNRDNSNYALAALSYKTQYADIYTVSERMRLLNDYTTYIAKYPDNAALTLNRAVMMDKVGYLSGALAEYEKLGNNSAALMNNRGVARLKASRVTEAEADFTAALAKDANLAEAHFNLAIVYAWKGHTDKSITHLNHAVEANPEMKKLARNNDAFKTLRANPAFKRFMN